MSDYGVAGNTDYDFNDNGFRDFEDALMLSRHLGTNCPQAEVQATTGIISGLLIEPVDTLQQDLIRRHRYHPCRRHYLPALRRGQRTQMSTLSAYGATRNSP